MNKTKKLFALLLALVMTLALAACGGSGSKSSSGMPKNVEIQLPASAGGGTDVACRALTAYMNANSGSNFTVVNNTDGSGVVAMETVRTGPADGSKILFFHTTMAIKTATGLYDHSAAEDFKVIGVGLPIQKGGYVLVCPKESGITTVSDFIAAANEKGGNMLIGVGTGGSSHIMAGIMSRALGISLNYVEAGSDTEKLTALVGGNIDCALVNANQAKQYIEADKVNAIACFSATDEGGRNSVIPDVPSFKEEGYDCVFGTYFYILANSGMSDETAQAILAAFSAAASDEETAALLESSGFGMEFAPYADGKSLIEGQQSNLNAVCAELGLAG